jgi:hypothetical protein
MSNPFLLFLFLGVIARHPLFIPYLRKHLTAEAVENYFSYLFEDIPGTKVERYVLTISFSIG